MDPNQQTQSIQAETPVQTNLQQQSVNKIHSSGSKFKLILLIIILLIIVGGGAYLLGTKQNIFFFQNQQKPTPTSVQSTPTPTLDPTANWQTYVSSRGKYQIRYPNDWNFIDAGNKPSDMMGPVSEINTIITNIMFYPLYSKNDPIGIRDSIFIEVDDNPNNLSLEDFVVNQEKWKDNESYAKFKSIKVDGVDAKRGTLPSSSLFSILENIYIKKDLHIYNISFRVQEAGGIAGKIEKKIFDQVLSTFKFINQSQSNNKKIKTYKNNTLGIQFQYPSDWKIIEDQDLQSATLYPPTSDPNRSGDYIGFIYVGSIPFSPQPSPELGMTPYTPITINGVQGIQTQDNPKEQGRVGGCTHTYRVILPLKSGTVAFDSCISLMFQFQEILKTLVLQ